MKYLSFLLICVFLFSITACGKTEKTELLPDVDSSDLAVNPSRDNKNNTFITNESTLTVYIYAIEQYNFPGFDPYDYLTELVQKAGLNMQFKKYYVNLETPPFEQTIAEADSHSVYFTDMQSAIKLYESNLLGDFYNQAAQYSPIYLNNISDTNFEDKLIWMPVGKINMPSRLVFIVRKDIDSAYGKAITTASEYEALLHWIKDRYPNETPGVITSLFLDEIEGIDIGYSAFNLFLPEMGYTSFSGLFLDNSGVSNVLWRNNETGDVRAFYEMDDAKTALIKLAQWRDENLITFQNDDEMLEPVYPTILSHSTRLPGVAFGDDYTITNFYQQTAYSAFSDWYAVAAPGADVSEFLKFMEMMQNIDFYKRVRYGVEGEDYKVVNGFISKDFKNEQEDYVIWNGVWCFLNTDFDNLLEEGRKVWADLSAGLPPVEYPLDFLTRYNIGKQLATHERYNKSMITIKINMNTLLDKIYGEVDEPNITPHAIVDETFDTLTKYGNEDSGLPLAVELVNQALSKP